jgi:hypothetical protein
MLCHESVESYYTSNFSALFYATSSKVNITNRFTLDDLESMLPYEREIYLTMMQNKMKKIEEKINKK